MIVQLSGAAPSSSWYLSHSNIIFKWSAGEKNRKLTHHSAYTVSGRRTDRVVIWVCCCIDSAITVEKKTGGNWVRRNKNSFQQHSRESAAVQSSSRRPDKTVLLDTKIVPHFLSTDPRPLTYFHSFPFLNLIIKLTIKLEHELWKVQASAKAVKRTIFV